MKGERLYLVAGLGLGGLRALFFEEGGLVLHVADEGVDDCLKRSAEVIEYLLSLGIFVTS